MRRLRNHLLLAAAALAGAALWVGFRSGEGGAEEAGRQVVAFASEGSRAMADAGSPASSERLAAVEKVVAERNAANAAQREAFEAAGWTIRTDVPPPDERLTSYDVTLIRDGREEELYSQLASTLPGRGDVRAIQRIALAEEASDRTRYAAVQALGRIKSEEAQHALIALLESEKLAPGTEARDNLAVLIHPRDLDDPIAGRIASLIDSPVTTMTEKRQLALTLSVIGLRDGMTLRDDVLTTLSPEALALLDSTKALALRGFSNDLHFRGNHRHQD